METGKYGDLKTTLRWKKLKLFCTDLINLDLNGNDFFPMNCNTHTHSILCARAYIFLLMKTLFKNILTQKSVKLQDVLF